MAGLTSQPVEVCGACRERNQGRWGRQSQREVKGTHFSGAHGSSLNYKGALGWVGVGSLGLGDYRLWEARAGMALGRTSEVRYQGGSFSFPEQMEFGGRSTGQEPTCLGKADDVILLAPVGFRRRPLRGPVETLQRSPQGSSGHRPAQGGAPAEAQLGQDAPLGQVKQQLPVALHVQGRLPAGRTLSVSSGSGPPGCGQDQGCQEQGADHRQGACLSSAPETELQPRDSGSPAVVSAPSLPAAGGPGSKVCPAGMNPGCSG